MDDFTQLALDLFAFQFSQNEAYANLCRSECRTPDSVNCWEEIPAVPTRAFKSLDLTALPHSERHTVFRSSGTTQSERSLHHHNRSTLAVYEASLWAWFERHMVDGNTGRLLFLFPKPSDAPESSLGHMMATVAKHLSKIEHRFVADDQWRIDGQAATDFCTIAPLKTSQSRFSERRFRTFICLIFWTRRGWSSGCRPAPLRWKPAATRGARGRWPSRSCHGRSLPGLVSSRSGSFENMACAN